MLDYVTRSLIECYKGSDFHYFWTKFIQLF
jgi:hypothetical protein